MKPIRFALFALLLAAVAVSTARTEEPLAKKVREAIDNGVSYLKKAQQDRGGGEYSWENKTESQLKNGGASVLSMLALLTAGTPKDDPVIVRGIKYVRSIPRRDTYVVGLQTMILAEFGDTRDLGDIQANVDWLLKGRRVRGGKLAGWGYGGDDEGSTDNSNSQYALLGLLAGRQAGATIAKKDWEQILDFYRTTQKPDPRDDRLGGWGYQVGDTAEKNTQTMTGAGVSGLLIAGLEAGQNRQGLDEATGIAARCGVYDENKELDRGMRWLGKTLTFKMRTGFSFYNIYGIERVGRLSGQRFIGDHDWYREGCELLTGGNPREREFGQRSDGSWHIGPGGADALPISSTAFSLLFLSRGRTPILVSKLAFDTRGNTPGGIVEWNRKHHDARHMVEYASKELFRRRPLAWQVYDPRRTDLSTKTEFDDELATLLQSPILYINGHLPPELTARQKEMLKRYVEEGGFVLAEACCGSTKFAEGFRELVKEILPDNQLAPLPPSHSIWKSHALVSPAEFPKLEGLEMGCRTVMVFSPEPLAGFWEESRFMPRAGLGATNRGELTFRLAGNIIAYATGLELPRDRLDVVRPTERKDEGKLPRHLLKIGQVRLDIGHRDAPQAVRNLAGHLRDQYRLDVSVEREDIRMSQADLGLYPILYMHGAGKFTVEDDEIKNLRNAIEVGTGSILLADASCGKKEFDTAFREFAAKLYPNGKLVPIPANDPLFDGTYTGGVPVGKVKCRVEKADGSPTPDYQEIEPRLEGIRVGEGRNARWVVVYSRYDLGCALEKAKSTSCRAYDFESAKKLASAVVLYALGK